MHQEPLKVFLIFVSALCTSFLLSSFLTKRIINFFRKSHRGQSERNFLSCSLDKTGTPTMGGIAFILSSLTIFILFSIPYKWDNSIWFCIMNMIGFAMVGFIDDFMKLKRNNYKGVKGIVRLLIEINIIVFSLALFPVGELSLHITSSYLYLSIFSIPFIIFVILGSSNSMNLTDGIDGLASGLYLIALTPFLFISLLNNNYLLSLFIICLIGSLLGFLRYNMYPAKVFMGDVGSLFLGTSLACFSIVENRVLVLMISGLILIFETISVIIQVFVFKTTGKRVFLMTPFHHHFQKKGWPEWKIVLTFWIIGVMLAAISMIFGI